MTISAATRYLKEQILPAYSEGEADAISRIVVQHLTGLEKTDRAIAKDLAITTLQSAEIEKIIPRLLDHEPVQYIIGESWFCGLKFSVNRHVLIPRPETEELVEWIISNCRFPVSELRILDIGTGSGCIAITLKRRIRKADVWACDVSTGAIETAIQNAVTLGADVTFRQFDMLDTTKWDTLPEFDIIVSNPPYVPLADKKTMEANVLAWEPHTALFVPDDNPLLFYEAIATFSNTHLHENGSLYFEMHENLGEQVSGLLAQKDYDTTIKNDMQGKARMVRAERQKQASA